MSFGRPISKPNLRKDSSKVIAKRYQEAQSRKCNNVPRRDRPEQDTTAPMSHGQQWDKEREGAGMSDVFPLVAG